MRIFDFMHAYQPFFSENLPDWVIKNLEEVFIPLSKSFASDLCRHTVQIQGWTLESWDKDPRTHDLFQQFLENMRKAIGQGTIEVGFSAYSHPILPLLSNQLIEMQIEEDYKTVLKYLGEPKVFFPPEGAIDQRVLNIVSSMFPEIKILVPDRAISEEMNSNFYWFRKNVLAVFPVIVKDALMGAPYFDRPPAFIPSEVVWSDAKKALKSHESLSKFFEQLGLENAIIARDMENGESRNALKEFGPRMKEIPSLTKTKIEKSLISEGIPNKDSIIDKILPASWEPLSHEEDPFPFWSPRGEYFMFLTTPQKNLIKLWLSLIELYDALILMDKTLFKETSPTIISCFPWHFTTPLEWDNNIGFSEYIMKNCIIPNFNKLLKTEDDKKRFNEIITAIEENLNVLQEIKRRNLR